MAQSLAETIKSELRRVVLSKFDIALETIHSEIPPRTELGDLAFPLCFELAKQIKNKTGQKANPRQLAEQLLPFIAALDPRITRVEIAGPGYLNVFYDRAAFFTSALSPSSTSERPAVASNLEQGKIIVEHTSINPNKAAHIGHLRNAVLGDTIVRVLRALGDTVEIENYVDNTGVQVADVVVGFIYLEGKTLPEIESIQDKFDYYCWDLYAKVGAWYEEAPERKELRAKTLHELEAGDNETARIAEHISTLILKAHLATMERLGIRYDVLPRESDILHLKFWDYAFERLKAMQAIVYETEGRNKGCWVMRAETTEAAERVATTEETDRSEDAEQYDADKIIVRSNGTVTYVGKDIAYTLWKVGKLGMDFYYHPFHAYQPRVSPDSKVSVTTSESATEYTVWLTSSDKSDDTQGHPEFGNGVAFFNVIDVGQSYTQQNVLEGVRRIDPDPRIARSAHLAYEKVTLTPASAKELGMELSESDQGKNQIGMSGRKGLGVKADDLIDKLETNALAEVSQRHPDTSESEQRQIAHTIAVGALRYFLMKFTRSSIIAFDFAEALAFEGESGVYIQNATVRIGSIFRKLADAGIAADDPIKGISQDRIRELFTGADGDEWWSLVYLASRLDDITSQAAAAIEPAIIAKYAFQLAQRFNIFYQKYRILSEPDLARRGVMIAIADYLRKQLTASLALLGIEVPVKM